MTKYHIHLKVRNYGKEFDIWMKGRNGREKGRENMLVWGREGNDGEKEKEKEHRIKTQIWKEEM